MKIFKKIIIMFLATLIFTISNNISGFAIENYRINNKIFEFTKVIYVDSEGDDIDGNGSEKFPFKSLYKCLDYLCTNNLKEDVAIVIGDGEYDWSDIVTGSLNNINPKFENMKVSFIAKNPGEAFIFSTNGLKLITVENNKNSKIKLKFYGLVFHNITGDDERTCLGGDSWMNEYYNCVFDNINVGGWNALAYDACIKTQNCLFYNCIGNIYCPILFGEGINNASTNDIIEPLKGSKTSCLTNVVVDSDYYITSGEWENKGTGTNPDRTQANIGVYGGEFAWGEWSKSKDDIIVGISLNKKVFSDDEEFYADIYLDKLNDIAAEDIRIEYDSSKIKFLDTEEVEGIKLMKKQLESGSLRVMLVSKGKENIPTSKKTILRVKFRAIAKGDALINIIKCKIADGKYIEDDLFYDECGEAIVKIEDFKDPNKDGEFTLSDLALDGCYYGKNTANYPRYNLDVSKNGVVDEFDLMEISDSIINNPNYKF